MNDSEITAKPTNVRRVVIAAAVIALCATLIALLFFHSSAETQSSVANPPSSVASTQPSESIGAPDYKESIDPYELSKNPYKLMGHFGILDTVHTPVILSNGQRLGSMKLPVGGLQFSKMLDPHIAIYEITTTGELGPLPGGEIAVILPNSNEPDPTRQWLVRVEKPIEAENAFGSTIQVSAVRFDGYYVEQNMASSNSTTPDQQGTSSQANGEANESVSPSDKEAQSIPAQLIGIWVVKRELPTSTVACWDQSQADKLIGTEIEYTASGFRWNATVTMHPSVRVDLVNAEQFQSEYSGSGSSVNFGQLGIRESQVMSVELSHPDAQITGSTVEIPGDDVLMKDQNTIIFSVCNVYFEAQRK